MLDVHPPHETPHSWRDFFIHIATIVVGLLIAVGLEQTVEWLHHRSEVAETRAALNHERALNARISVVMLDEFRRITPRLKGDMAVFAYLRDHPGAPPGAWPDRISWNSLSATYVTSAWKSAQQGAILPLMPRRDVQRYNELYSRLANTDDSYDGFIKALEAARRYTFRNIDPAAMSREQIDVELARLDDLLAAHLVRGRNLNSLSIRFAGFAGPSRAELLAFNPGSSDAGDNAQVYARFKQIQAIKDEAE